MDITMDDWDESKGPTEARDEVADAASPCMSTTPAYHFSLLLTDD